MMKATIRSLGKVTVLDMSGKITIGEGDLILREKVHEILAGGSKNLLLNLENISYMDSAGIGELVASFKKTREKGGTIKLLKPSGKVADLLTLTMLEEVFETFNDESRALVSFQS
jgi:anti-sigma B factor antagonist